MKYLILISSILFLVACRKTSDKELTLCIYQSEGRAMEGKPSCHIFSEDDLVLDICELNNGILWYRLDSIGVIIEKHWTDSTGEKRVEYWR